MATKTYVATEVDVVTQSVLKEEKGSGRDQGLCCNRNSCHDRTIGSRQGQFLQKTGEVTTS